jgi:hypothetical protein
MIQTDLWHLRPSQFICMNAIQLLKLSHLENLFCLKGIPRYACKCSFWGKNFVSFDTDSCAWKVQDKEESLLQNAHQPIWDCDRACMCVPVSKHDYWGG